MLCVVCFPSLSRYGSALYVRCCCCCAVAACLLIAAVCGRCLLFGACCVTRVD